LPDDVSQKSVLMFAGLGCHWTRINDWRNNPWSRCNHPQCFRRLRGQHCFKMDSN